MTGRHAGPWLEDCHTIAPRDPGVWEGFESIGQRRTRRGLPRPAHATPTVVSSWINVVRAHRAAAELEAAQVRVRAVFDESSSAIAELDRKARLLAMTHVMSYAEAVELLTTDLSRHVNCPCTVEPLTDDKG